MIFNNTIGNSSDKVIINQYELRIGFKIAKYPLSVDKLKFVEKSSIFFKYSVDTTT